MKKLISVVLAFALITCGVVYYTNENNAYAVSDDDNDQAVKLKVRDAILKNVGDRLSKTDKNECRDEIINDLKNFFAFFTEPNFLTLFKAQRRIHNAPPIMSFTAAENNPYAVIFARRQNQSLNLFKILCRIVSTTLIFCTLMKIIFKNFISNI